MIHPRYWVCCGWRSFWCITDNVNHFIGKPCKWICDRHDDQIIRVHLSEEV